MRVKGVVVSFSLTEGVPRDVTLELMRDLTEAVRLVLACEVDAAAKAANALLEQFEDFP